MSDSWASDVQISMPEPLPHTAQIPMHGFVFTEFGLYHDLSEADHERLSRPTYAPEDPDLRTEISNG